MANNTVGDLNVEDATLCLRVAHQIEQRGPREREDQLIILALRHLAATVLERT